MKRILLAGFLFTCAGTAFAQQQPNFTHYPFVGLYLNPAYAGIKEQGEITALGRYQYLGYSGSFDDGGSPQTYLLSASLPVPVLGGGIGVQVYRDVVAVLKTTNAQLSYSKHFKIGEAKLGIGIQGVYNHVGQGGYRPVDPNDPRVPIEGSDAKFDLGAGVWYEAPKFYAGLSVNNLLRADGYRYLAQPLDPTALLSETARYLNENHSYLTAGYNIEASSSVVVTPTILMKMVLPGKFGDSDKFNFKNNSYEAGVRATVNDRYWAGLGYRYDESITGLVGFSFGKDNAARVGLAYDLIAFNQDARALSSVELMLSYRLPKPGVFTRPAVRTPRYSF